MSLMTNHRLAAFRLRPRSRRILLGFFTFIFFVAVFSYLTNPFVRFTLVKDPHPTVDQADGEISLVESEKLELREAAFWYQLGRLKSGWHIVSNNLTFDKKADKTSVSEIINEIHQLRFDPSLPFLISGDHFSVLYPRSLGIFYHSALDSRTALSETDWQNRQKIYLKTVAYALSVYDQADRLSTTIVPIAPSSVILVDFHHPPSDTLYSLLYGLKVLQDQSLMEQLYPFEGKVHYELQTQNEAKNLLAKHEESLKRHLDDFRTQNYDPNTGLIKMEAKLSGTKDQVVRQSAFYDNVIWWRTQQLAQELGLEEAQPQELADYKQRILTTYWQDDVGVFLEDLSSECVSEKCYSSDWLIVLMTGFLDPLNPAEAKYYQKSVEYIRRNALDQPFGLQYHSDIRRREQVPLLRLTNPAYGSTAIWSNWGMEYIKTLILLNQETGDREYLDIARDQLEAYTFNIRRYRGYPELYDEQGDFYRTWNYKAVRRTGWVVSFEQAWEMFEQRAE